ncbi:phytanoyl-CoA dioxygenase [Alkalilimnicola ehrlichii]|nr:phytanoyl-CoA dioxygenase [Alkalilimnicola ehrlichii]
MPDSGFSADEVERFARDGFLIARDLAEPAMLERMQAVIDDHLARRVPPLELEAELQYPGAPASTEVPGGQAIRRLRRAYERDDVFRYWLSEPALLARLQQLLGESVLMTSAHHNSLMTKHPRYSSDSLWHQDIRYWRYSRRELVTAWLALGEEHERNGGLQLIPGSHRMDFAPERFDEALFLRQDLPENQVLLARRVAVTLHPGDVLFFHCRLLHAATRNYEGLTKCAVVFTFRAPEDVPEPGSRSASLPDVPLPVVRF